MNFRKYPDAPSPGLVSEALRPRGGGLPDFFRPYVKTPARLAPSCQLPDGPAVHQVTRCIDEASAKIGACRKHIAGCAEEKDSEHDSLPILSGTNAGAGLLFSNHPAIGYKASRPERRAPGVEPESR